MRPRRRAPIRAQYAMCSVTTRIALLGGCAGSLKPAWGSADRCVTAATRPRGRRDVPTVFVRRCDHSALRLSYIIRPGCRKSARARSGALAMAAERRANGLSIRFPAMALALAGRGPGRILSLLWRAWGLDWLLQAFPGISAARIMGVAAGGQLLIPARDRKKSPGANQGFGCGPVLRGGWGGTEFARYVDRWRRHKVRTNGFTNCDRVHRFARLDRST
jgi:hypothetical protein